MTIDLYYSNFSNVGQQLEDLYNTYLITQHSVAEETKSKRIAAAKVTEAKTQKNTIRSISGISSELSKKGAGFQRPAGNSHEFVNRPLKASERLKFVRDQCKAQEKSEINGHPAADSERNVVGKIEETKKPSKTPTRKPGLLATPVSPNDESDWLAEDAAHRQLQDTLKPSDGSSVWIPSTENARNHGNGSPHKYSKSVSPNRGPDADHYFNQNMQRNRVQPEGSHSNHSNSSANQSSHQLGRSQDRHLDDMQGKQKMGRGRGRRVTNSKAGGQNVDHRDSLYSGHFPAKGTAGQTTSERNGPHVTQSDDESDVWEKGLQSEGIYHHSPVAVKYAEEFLEFLDN